MYALKAYINNFAFEKNLSKIERAVETFSIECLVKVVKKYFLKKLNVWLALIKVAVLWINYQKGQCIYKRVYFILFFLDVSFFHT